MEKAVFIELKLEPKLAEALLLHLRQELRSAIQQQWHAARYLSIPETSRCGAILRDAPHLAAQKKTLGALKAALDRPRREASLSRSCTFPWTEFQRNEVDSASVDGFAHDASTLAVHRG
ncbi:hypothetical protein [Azotobacter vinelandii]|uniref:hypothetical protein n=1 Tax=Azotobacter vinelandii TaxID=354 RepID=UPI000774B615|nr:hypothetical protein [Azotobacter vinelandii]WKN22419.1 hypothetical protein AVAEIV_000391 [Azotobacter vinelandii]